MGRGFRVAAVLVELAACGPSTSGPSGASDGTTVATAGTEATNTTSSASASTEGTSATGSGAASSTGCFVPAEGTVLDVEGQVVLEVGFPGDGPGPTGVSLVPCSEPQWSLELDGDVLGLIPCGGTFAHVRGTVHYPADSCFPFLAVDEVVESRACDPTDCAAPCEAEPNCLWFTECSTQAQDCPEGTKCGPTISEYRTVYDGAGCSALVAQPDAAGDPCVVYNLATGHDSCEAGSACLGSSEVDSGVCTPFCSGSDLDPSCPPDRSCVVTGGGALSLCLTLCDPQASDCPVGSSCVTRSDQSVCLDDDDLARIIDDPDAPE